MNARTQSMIIAQAYVPIAFQKNGREQVSYDYWLLPSDPRRYKVPSAEFTFNADSFNIQNYTKPEATSVSKHHATDTWLSGGNATRLLNLAKGVRSQLHTPRGESKG
jgi:hypothetical protein